MTPLMYAAKAGKTELCRYLIMKGADVNAVDHEVHSVTLPNHPSLTHSMHSHATGLFRVATPCCLLSAMAFETRGSTWCGAAVTSLSLTQHGYTTTMLVHTRKATADSSLLCGTHISQAWSALHWAAMRGDAVLTRTLLTAGCNVYQMSRVCPPHTSQTQHCTLSTKFTHLPLPPLPRSTHRKSSLPCKLHSITSTMALSTTFGSTSLGATRRG